MNGYSDTISAVCTPIMKSAIGVIRVSGDNAFDICGKIFSKNLSEISERSAVHGEILDGGKPLDDVVLTLYRAPRSFTGENTVEISCHGSTYIMNRIQKLLIDCGARQAEGGEFTKRAFLHGKIDLAQAEAVVDLIESESAEEAKNAAGQLGGRLSRKINEINGSLIDVSAQILAFIDYPDDEIADVSPETLQKSIFSAHEQLKLLKNSFGAGQIMREGIRTAIVGKPNVGKSCLMNRILGCDRSIVTDIAGTTRDVIEEKAVFGGKKLVVSDTAGIHETADVVEKIGVSRSIEKIEDAALILCVFDVAGIDWEDLEIVKKVAENTSAKKIAIFNKSDLDPSFTPEAAFGNIGEIFDKIAVISLKNDAGIEVLENAVAALFETDMPDGASLGGEILTNIRHYECICRAEKELENALLNINTTPDALISDIEGAIESLGAMTGKSVSEQIINNIFSRFCVGK